MSEPIEDGGNVFPKTITAGDKSISEGGLSLRDYFAGQALAGYMAQPDGGFCYEWQNDEGERRLVSSATKPGGPGNWRVIATPMENMAESMYAHADAMLKARAAK